MSEGATEWGARGKDLGAGEVRERGEVGIGDGVGVGVVVARVEVGVTRLRNRAEDRQGAYALFGIATSFVRVC